MKKLVTNLWLALFFLLSAGTLSVTAEEYQFGPEDILSVSFWQDPKLNAQVRVAQDGTITLDIIGSIVAAGKTAEGLQDDIVRAMSRLNTSISQAVVRVAVYNYNHVYVTGQVGAAGKKTFEQIPDLWTIINEAGGPGPLGDLTRVTIVRGGSDAGKVEVVNVADAIAKGQTDKLPKIRRQDTIEIPATPSQLPAQQLGSSAEGSKSVIYVVGAVNQPGPKAYEEDIDLLELLALSGGPASNADLGKTKLITKDGPYAQTLKIDLNKYVKSGTPARYIVRKEDTFVVPQKKSGILGIGLPTLGATLGIATSAVLLIDRLKGN